LALFRIEKCYFPCCNEARCATQHDFLRGKKIFHIVKYCVRPAADEKKPVHEHRFSSDMRMAEAARGRL
jgi:hypothetical protein